MEHQAAPPTDRVAADRHRPAGSAVLQREAVEAVQQAVAAPLVDLPGEIQEAALVTRGCLVERGSGVGGGLDGIAGEIGAGMVGNNRQATEVAAPEKAHIGTVVEGSRLARRIPLHIARGKPLGGGVPLDARVELGKAACRHEGD